MRIELMALALRVLRAPVCQCHPQHGPRNLITSRTNVT
jgi:hypothetical protein